MKAVIYARVSTRQQEEARTIKTQLDYILNHSGSTFLFCDSEFAELVRPIQSNLETVKHVINIIDTN